MLQKTIYLLTALSVIISCRKELDYNSTNQLIEITLNTPNLDSLWEDEWQNQLLVEWNNTLYGYIYQLPEAHILVSFFKPTANGFNYSHSQCHPIGVSPLHIAQGTYRFILNSTESKVITLKNQQNGDILATTRRLSDSIHTSPDNLFIGSKECVNIHNYHTLLDFDNGVWTEIIKVPIETCIKQYIIQIITRQTKYNNITIRGVYLGGMYNELNLHNREMFGNSYLKNNKENLHRINDTLTICKIGTFGIADTTNKVLIDYHMGQGRSALITKDISTCIKRQPNGGIITIFVDLDQETGKNNQGGFNPELEEWISNSVIVPM